MLLFKSLELTPLPLARRLAATYAKILDLAVPRLRQVGRKNLANPAFSIFGDWRTAFAYNDAASRTPAVTVAGDLGGLTLTPGVYKSGSSLGLTGELTLDAQGNSDAVFIFQAGSTLTTASGSSITLINGYYGA